MKTIHAGIGLLLGGVLVWTLGAQESPTQSVHSAIVVGTFDSRAIAVAYAQSADFRAHLVAKKTEVTRDLEQARADGDDELVASLESLGPAMQQRLHEQGFGTAPVDDIIEQIEDALPDIAADAGVDLIVSKWVLTYTSPEAHLVDVTNLLAAEFDPSPATLKMIQSTIEAEPVPLDEIDHDH